MNKASGGSRPTILHGIKMAQCDDGHIEVTGGHHYFVIVYTINGDALSELVKCKTSKYILPSKSLINSNISGS
jgi:hypothetical protein